MIDDKSKKQLTALGLLIPLLLGLIWFNIPKKSPAPSAPPAGAPGVPAPSGAPAAEAAPPQAVLDARNERIQSILSQPWGRNPFVAPVAAVAAAPAAQQVLPAEPAPVFNLEGIVYDAKNPYAVIDGELRVVGDTIRSYVITGITRDTVTLEKDGQSLDLKMFSEMR